ncbi:fibronectin type III domain-containing protein [Catenovulum sediminis]|uniref:fibronectin type III domain-containing protein n=1 Tax=Catenovulum sediminis TaxID=1740262 RepID=UPI00117CDB4C|nr:hypothetical protein [Catenovulum sediminis]
MMKQFKSVLLLVLCCWLLPLNAAYNTALLNLKPLDIDSIGFDGDIQFSLRSNLDRREEVQMMSRRDMESELFRQGIAMGNSDAEVLKVGKALGVEFIIYGEVQMSENGIATTIKMLDIVHERLAKNWNINFSGRNDINEKGAALANGLVKAMAQSLVDAKVEAQTAAKQADAQSAEQFNLLAAFTATSNNKGISLSWQPIASGAYNKYNIYRAETSVGPFTQIAALADTHYLDSQVENKKQYFYKIGLVDASNGLQTEDSNMQTVIYVDESLKNRPLSPTILSVETGVKQSKITFVPNLDNRSRGHNVYSYKIYRKRQDGGHWLHVGSIRLTSGEPKLSYQYFDKSNIEDGVSYSYAVSAVTKNNESTLSGTEVVISPGTPVLSVGQDNQLREIELAWVVENANGGFYIYRRVAGTTIWQRIADIKQANVRRFIDRKGLLDGTQYEYYVSLVNNGKETDPSNIVTARTKALPATPQNFTAQSGLVKAVQLNWQALADLDIAGYKLYRMKDDGNGFQEGDQLTLVHEIKGVETQSFLDQGSQEAPLLDGTQYHYAIAAMNKFGARGNLSYVASATTKALPKSVGEIQVQVSSTQIQVNWPAPASADIKQFHLSRKWNNQSWVLIRVLPANETQYIDADLKPYAATTYQLIAEDNSGLMSSPIVSNPVINPAKLVLKVSKENLLRKIELSWHPQNNITGYKIYRKEEGDADWSKLAVIESASTSRYTDEYKLEDGRRYQYQISALDGELETPASEPVTAKTKAVPQPPKNFTVQSGLVKTVVLRWEKINDADVAGYYLYKMNDKGRMERLKTIKDRNIVEYTDDGSLFNKLSDGTEYQYAITAYNRFNAEGGRSPIIKATTKPVPAVVATLEASYQNGAVDIRWPANSESDIQMYEVEKASASCSSWRDLATLTASQTKTSDTDVTAGTKYCYRIKAIDSDALESAQWQSTEINIPATP